MKKSHTISDVREVRFLDIHGSELLEYIADLIGQMKDLAEREACPKLVALLTEARAEAIREALNRVI